MGNFRFTSPSCMLGRRYRVAVLAVAVLLLAPTVIAQESIEAAPFFGRVVSISAANSLIVQADSGQTHQVVLAFLSIPVPDQPYSDRAHSILRAQLLGRRVSVRPIGHQSDDYTLGLVYVGSQNFNLDFLSRGHAWVDYFQISHPSWLTAQQRARSARLGLYANAEAKHPLHFAAEMKKADTIVGATDAMADDTAATSAVMSAFVGNRGLKEFVPIRCIETWANWRRADLVPLLTVAGATDSGFSLIPCSDSPQQAVTQ